MPDASELLLEVGTEELPASFVAKAVSDLAAAVGRALDEHRLGHGEATTYATPRRLIVAFAGVPERQEDATERRRGPALKAAYDESGAPTKALLGFCRGAGVDPATLEHDEQYVWANLAIAGRPTREILAETLPKAITGLQFDKSMRWGTSRLRFARPLRWILATLGGEVVPFGIESVTAGTTSAGHRFYAPERFEATTLDALVAGLRERKVEPDPARRREMILAGTAEVAGGEAEIPEALLDENVYLTEWPTALAGTFPDSYLELPEPVLVTAMAKHERMFPVRDGDGKLLARYVFVRNGGEDESVRRGTEWVLGARFNDARFFFDEDAKSTMDDFLAKTEGILFQAKLGSVRARADRLAALAAAIAETTGGEIEAAREAGRYAKADLASGLVSELPSLQGVVGGAYAARDGMAPEVASAIAGQYAASPPPATDAATRTGAVLVVADALDKLAGYLGLGLEPTGSSDPYALRRAVGTLIEVALGWPGPFPSYEELLGLALAEYHRQGHVFNEVATLAALNDVFLSRYPVLMPEVRYDVLDAALLREYREELTFPRNVAFRAELLGQLAGDHAFVQTATRPMNIVVAAKRKGIEYAWGDPLNAVDPAALGSTEGEALLTLLRSQEDAVFRAAREGDVAGLEALLRGLKEPIDAFFEATLVMAEEPDARYARLSLAHAAALQLLHAGDFTKLVQEG